MKKKILITAFEPFGGLDLNSSSMVLDNIKSTYKNILVSKQKLPVLYGEAFAILSGYMDSFKPDLVICMGQAGGRKNISIERIAVNINSGTLPDNGGILKTDRIIIEKSPNAYFTNLPYKKMLEAGKQQVQLSYSAGTYICNDIFYRLMHNINCEDNNIKGGFIHLPYTEHFGKMPYIDLEKQVIAIEAMITAAGETNEH